MSQTIHTDRATAQAHVETLRRAGLAAFLLCFPDGRMVVRHSL